MRWLLLLLLLTGCETAEVRAWQARVAELERRVAELTQLEVEGPNSDVETFRRAIDLPGLLRERSSPARLFVEPGVVRITTGGTVQECRDTVHALADVRWLTDAWRLRLENGRCEWETRTGADYVTLENALSAPPEKWTPPPSQLLSSGVAELRATVAALEADLRNRETRLGAAAVLQGKIKSVKKLMYSMHTRPAPCDVPVLDRELALDADKQGQLLEVERSRLIHPLEPRTDFRLRGFAEFQDGVVTWHCQAL